MDALGVAREAAVLSAGARWAELLEFLRARIPDAERVASTELAYRTGEALYHLGRMEELAEHASAFEAAARRRRDVAGTMRALNLRGIAAFELGRTEEARDAFDTLMALAEAEHDDDMLARACLNLGAVANLEGDPATALTLYQLAIPVFQRLDQSRGLSQTHQSLAMSLRDLGRFDDADDAYREAMRLGLEHGYPPIVAMASLGRAELLVLRDDPAPALGLVEWGLGLARRLGDPITEGTGLRIRGRARIATAELREADADLRRALQAAVDTKNRLLEAETLRDLAALARREGDYAAAGSLGRRAADVFRSFGARHAAAAIEAAIDPHAPESPVS
jgi:tetratricopeptide (TPR) repeat protein